tara:strand:+ start:190 stop:450 length:261 start_codon:yes stop_codon:yes gene_type:complete
MQVVLSGTLAFEILDRITGEWSVVDTDWASEWIVEVRSYSTIRKSFVARELKREFKYDYLTRELSSSGELILYLSLEVIVFVTPFY